MNYAPQYWQLRTNEGQSTAEAARPLATAARTPAWVRATSTRYTDDEAGAPASPAPASSTSPTPRRWSTRSSAVGETVGAGTLRPPRDGDPLRSLARRRSTRTRRRLDAADSTSRVKTLSQGIPSDLVFNTENSATASHYTKTGQSSRRSSTRARDRRQATDEEKADRQVAHRPRQGLLAAAEEPPRLRGHEVSVRSQVTHPQAVHADRRRRRSLEG